MTLNQHRCQAVVAGTGAGGAVAGAMLAEAGIDTIFLEWGKRHGDADHKDIVDSMARMYINGAATVAMGHPPIMIPLGRAVGGTTLINSATCFRTPREKVAEWCGPSYEELEPLFEEVERRINVVVLDEELLGSNGRLLKRGCDKLGLEIKPLMHNVRDCKGRGRCAFGCPEGAKQSMDLTFIPNALASGARLYPEHKVDGILVENSKIIGLRGKCSRGGFEVRADVIVLAMGAMFTPVFLLKHKIANRSGRVGKNLNIHPAARVVAEFNEVVDGFKGVPQGIYIDHWKDRGVMIEGVFTPPGPLLASMPGAGPEFKTLAASYRHLASSGVMVSDTSTGSVRPGWFGSPFHASYQINQTDAEAMRFGIARLTEIYLAAGAKRIFTSFAPVPVVEGSETLARLESFPLKPSHLEMLAFHPLGTCAMGSDPDKSVVNFGLQSHGIDNLYIMDASTIPKSLGVNPQITTMTLAMRAGRLLAERLKKKA